MPLEGGVEELERYYRSMARVIYCLFPPLTVGAIFGSGEALFLVPACSFLILVPYMQLGMIIMYSSSTSNSDKAKLWWDLAWHSRSRMLACFACGLLAYVLLRLWSQTQLEELLLSENFWQSVSMCAMWMIYFATATGVGVQHSNALMFQVGMPTSWGHKLTLFYILGQLSLIWTFNFSLAGLLLLPLFALVLWQYLRYRTDGSGQRLGSIYFMLQMALIMAALIIMARATVDIYLNVAVMGESIVPRPFPVAELVLWWLAPTALLLLISLALPYVQRRLLQLGMFPTAMPPPPGHDDTKALRKYHKLLKWPLELSQQQPILRKPWHLAWIRMVTWLGARAWLVGLLSVAVAVD